MELTLKCELSLRVRESEIIQNLFFLGKNTDCADHLTKLVLTQMKDTLAPAEPASQDFVSKLDLDFSLCSSFLSLLFKQCQMLSENLFRTGDPQIASKALSFLSSQILNKDLFTLFRILTENVVTRANFHSSKICFEFDNQLLLESDSPDTCKALRRDLNSRLETLLEALSKKTFSSFSLKLTSSPTLSFSRYNFAMVILLNLFSLLLTLIDELTLALHKSLETNFPDPPASLESLLSDLPSTRKSFLSLAGKFVNAIVEGLFGHQIWPLLKSTLIPLRAQVENSFQLESFARSLKRNFGRNCAWANFRVIRGLPSRDVLYRIQEALFWSTAEVL